MTDIATFLTSSISTLRNVLAGFDPTYSPDRELQAEVERLVVLHPSFFVDEYQLETNLADVARLLDRLFGARRELWDLEALRQRMALSYVSTIELAEADAALSLAMADEGQADSVRAAAQAKVDAAKRAVEALESRHAQEGGALNFAERIAKLRNTYRDDIESCHVRSEAVIRGISRRYSLQFPRPTPAQRTFVRFDGAGHLDDWAAWHRQLSRRLESLQASASSFEIAIPLATPFLFVVLDQRQDTRSETQFTVARTAVDDIRAGRDLSFSLLQIETPQGPGDDQPPITFLIPERFGRTCIRALSIQVDLTPASRREGWRFEVEVKPPEALAPVAMNVDTSISEPVWISATTIANRPAEGQWTLRFLAASATDNVANQVRRAQWPITDVRLLLRLEGV